MKVLCMCAGAVSRSVGLALALKKRGHDALAVSYDYNSPETIGMLCNWADRIITVMPRYAEIIPDSYRHKLTIYNVGWDKWQNPMHPELHALLETLIESDPLWKTTAAQER